MRSVWELAISNKCCQTSPLKFAVCSKRLPKINPNPRPKIGHGPALPVFRRREHPD